MVPPKKLTLDIPFQWFFLPILLLPAIVSGVVLYILLINELPQKTARKFLLYTVVIGISALLLGYTVLFYGVSWSETQSTIERWVQDNFIVLSILSGLMCLTALTMRFVVFPGYIWSTSFKSEIWKKSGQFDRRRMMPDLEDRIRRKKIKLKGMSAMEVIDLFGHPDRALSDIFIYEMPEFHSFRVFFDSGKKVFDWGFH